MVRKLNRMRLLGMRGNWPGVGKGIIGLAEDYSGNEGVRRVSAKKSEGLKELGD